MKTHPVTARKIGKQLARLVQRVFGPQYSVVQGGDPWTQRGAPAAEWPGIIEIASDSCDRFLVIDASPSMNERDYKPTRRGAAQDSARSFVQRVLEDSPDSRIAVIAYGASATVHCRLTPVRNTDTIHRAIDRIATIDMTSITAGLRAVADLRDGNAAPAQVVLLSDGHHNSGATPLSVARSIRGAALIETIGIGGSPGAVDEALLKAVASRRRDGTPRYRWIGDRSTLIQHFKDLGGGLTRQ